GNQKKTRPNDTSDPGAHALDHGAVCCARLSVHPGPMGRWRRPDCNFDIESIHQRFDLQGGEAEKVIATIVRLARPPAVQQSGPAAFGLDGAQVFLDDAVDLRGRHAVVAEESPDSERTETD